jgi:hypothetical protein
MAHQLPRSHADDTFNASKLDASTTSLLDLPVETVLEMASHLDKDGIKALRSTCTYMDATLLDTFGKQFFNCIYVMPTKFTMDALIQISKNRRIRHHVKELHICCSIYQHRERPSNHHNVFYIKRIFMRKLEESEMPYEDPSTPAEEATNEAVGLVRRGKFQEQLITALRGLKITRVEIHTYREWHTDLEGLKLGRSQLIQRTNTDPFHQVTQRAWEYVSASDDKLMDMVTCMTSVVLTAIEETLSPISTLHIPIVQIDKLRVSPSRSSKLTHLQDLAIIISVRDQELLGQQIYPTSPLDLFVMIDDLPNLHTLHLSTWPSQRLNHYSLPLYSFLPYLRPLALKTLHIHSLCDTSPLLIPFLSSLPLLQTLSLGFIVVAENVKNKPWRDQFLALKPLVSRPTLNKFVMTIDYDDAFQLASRLITAECKVESRNDDESENGDESENDDESKDDERRIPGREKMLDCLAKHMPNYHWQSPRRYIAGSHKREY